MEPTLAHLRLLLQRAYGHCDSPTLLRLPKHEQTVLGLCLNYIGGEVAALLLAKRAGERRWANLSEPMRARALLVALALALGLDPGVGGLDVLWHRSLSYATNIGWHLIADREWAFLPTAYLLPTRRDIQAPTVAAEPDPIKALVLAVLHVLEVPRG